jgi:triosephosphate isomerase (TIM)
VSADQLKDFDIQLVIIGNSERRKYFKETDEDVAEKWAIAVKYGLRPVLWVGENLLERDGDNTTEVINTQLSAVKAKVEDWSKIILVYEPVWTFKTGKVATPEQIQESHKIVRTWVKENISEDRAKEIHILYGGNITEKNCDDIISMHDVDGFLVGGTSIKKGFRFVVEQVSDYAES